MIDRRFIRPVPPENPYDRSVLTAGSVVDADLRGGRWVGLVIKKIEVEDEQKYLAYFDSPPDIILFKRRQLKPHLDWTGSEWVRPDNKKLARTMFSSGTMVELREDLTWREVMIVKELENEKRFIVKKCNNNFFSCCTGESENETVDSLRVRPKQPSSFSTGEYCLLDRVEAFRGFVWSQGTVRGILSEGRYVISLGETKKEERFHRSDLRPLMEWKDGNWHERVIKGKSKKENSSNGKRNSLGNESTREKMSEEHNSRKRKTRAEDNTISVLPFTKKSTIWNTYESMEVFKRVPQTPHFSPLIETKEDFREGSAIGMMATFSLLLEKLKDLKRDVLVTELESLKDSFLELEKHGFTITMPLWRINKLLYIKNRQSSLSEELKGFEKEKMDGSSEMRKADEEIDDIERKILELQRQRLIRKEQKKMAYEKICQKESRARDVGVKLKDFESEFELTLSALW